MPFKTFCANAIAQSHAHKEYRLDFGTLDSFRKVKKICNSEYGALHPLIIILMTKYLSNKILFLFLHERVN